MAFAEAVARAAVLAVAVKSQQLTESQAWLLHSPLTKDGDCPRARWTLELQPAIGSFQVELIDLARIQSAQENLRRFLHPRPLADGPLPLRIVHATQHQSVLRKHALQVTVAVILVHHQRTIERLLMKHWMFDVVLHYLTLMV